MGISIEELDDLAVARIRELVAARAVAFILPRNFGPETKPHEAIYPESATTTAKILSAAGLKSELLTGGGKDARLLYEHSVEWIGPTLFFGIALLTQNPAAASISLGLLTNYLTELFRGRAGQQSAVLEIVFESSDGNMKKIKYRGPVGGLNELNRTIASLGGGAAGDSPGPG